MIGAQGCLDDFENDFEKLMARVPGNGWTGDLRRRAMDRFRLLGFPSTRDEEWKYTSLEGLRKARLRMADAPETGLARGRDPFDAGGWERHALTFPSHDGADAGEEGLFIGRLAAALDRPPPWVEAHLARHADYDGHALRALNTAFLEDGGAVCVGPDRVLDRPVHLAFLADPGQVSNRMRHPRTLVVVGAGSRLTLVETYAGSGDAPYCTNAVTEVVLEDNAELDHYRLLREGAGAFHIGTVQVRQARNSRYRSLSVTSGGAMTRVEINARLDGEGADCLLHGLSVAGGAQHVDQRTTVEHARPHGTSRELYKGVLSGRSRGVFNGKVIVHKEARKTDAQQSNKNLLLSRDAEVDSKPQLEILADDVRCSHGTTIGQLEADELFYLRSRGLNEMRARELLVQGFASEVLDVVAIEPLRAGIADRVFSDLGG